MIRKLSFTTCVPLLRRVLGYGIFSVLLTIPSPAQDAEYGISMPVTVSGGAMYTQRLQLSDPNASPGAGAFRAMLYPTLHLGPNWFGYAAVQVRLTPYLYYDAFSPQKKVKTDLLQAFVGYSLHKEKASMLIKVGQLSSAFGAFPLHYDDAENPLLDQPLGYITRLPLRTGQLPCGTNDLLHQHYGSVSNSCGGAQGRGPGLVPVSLYGLPGFETDVSAGRLDARLQLTSGSPANPQNVGAAGQYLQWTAGGGYTIRHGFRVGVSGFRGPYLDRTLGPLLPAGTTVRDFPASAVGTDVQWARGRWSASGEVQRFRFESPNFVIAPSITAGYAELKVVLTPRLYLAGRPGWLSAGRVVDNKGVSAQHFASYLQSYEIGAGWWLSRNQLLKGSYEWLKIQGLTGTRTNVLGVQFVMTFHSLAWVF